MLAFDDHFMMNRRCFSVQKCKNEHKKEEKCAWEGDIMTALQTQTEREKG